MSTYAIVRPSEYLNDVQLDPLCQKFSSSSWWPELAHPSLGSPSDVSLFPASMAFETISIHDENRPHGEVAGFDSVVIMVHSIAVDKLARDLEPLYAAQKAHPWPRSLLAASVNRHPRPAQAV